MTKKENIIYGIRPVMEAILAEKEIEKIFIHRGARGELMGELKKLLKEKNIFYQEVPVEKLNSITRRNHQDVICFISPIAYHSLEDIVPFVFEKGESPLILILDRITDVRNFGAIARTAECAGVHVIAIPFRGSALINADAIKTSAGALNRIPVCKEKNLVGTIKFLKSSGLKIFAATEKSNKKIFQADLSEPCAIVLGSEQDGVSDELLKITDEKVSVPMFGEIESLNVSVACGVILYEAIRQRMFVKNN